MCKHVAAVLYGVGARLDEEPQFLFVLRGVDENELIDSAGQDLPLSKATPGAAKVLDDSDVAALFGIEIAETASADISSARKQSRRFKIVKGNKSAETKTPAKKDKSPPASRPSLNGSARFAPGNAAQLQDPKIEDKETRPPTRYNEGTWPAAVSANNRPSPPWKR